MSTLISLSMDHMTLVSAYLAGYDIVRLWCTGNKLVRRLLMGVDAFHLTQSFGRNMVFPKRLLSSLISLRSLRITSEVDVAIKSLPEALWDTSLNALVHLQLEVFCCQPFLRHVASHFPRLVSFKATASERFHFNDLLPLPDTLKVLVINKPTNGIRHPSSIETVLPWPSLPQDLEQFECSLQPFSIHPAVVVIEDGTESHDPADYRTVFPPRLHTLGITVVGTNHWKSWVGQLPTSLTSFTIDILRPAGYTLIATFGRDFYPSVFRRLPKLQHFGDTNLEYCPNYRETVDLDPATLPYTLTSLETFNFDIASSNFLSRMPPHLLHTLKHVLIKGRPLLYSSTAPERAPENIQTLNIVSDMRPRDWEVLPQSVTNLILDRAALPPSSDVYLPPKLRTLTCTSDGSFSARLPPTLTSLVLLNSPFGSNYPTLPTSLTSLIVSHAAFRSNKCWRQIRGLPLLTTLTLERPRILLSYDVLQHPEEAVYMPPSLTAFTAHFVTANLEYHQLLAMLCPLTLKEGFLLPNLKKLELWTQEPNGYVLPILKEAIRQGDDVWHFPPRLQRLRVTLLHPTADFFYSLPEGLLFLYIFGPREIVQQHIPQQWLNGRVAEDSLVHQIIPMHQRPVRKSSFPRQRCNCITYTIIVLMHATLVYLLCNTPEMAGFVAQSPRLPSVLKRLFSGS